LELKEFNEVKMANDIDFLDGPIPGASLTEELGKETHERPPIYTNPEEAFNYVIEGLSTEEALERLSVAAELGIPAELIARSIVFSGWAQGYYTIDIMLLIFEHVLGFLLLLFEESGIDYIKLAPRTTDYGLEEAFDELDRMDARENDEEIEDPEDPEELEEPEEIVEEEEIPTSGLMGRRE
jgi:hypothetical protein